MPNGNFPQQKGPPKSSGPSTNTSAGEDLIAWIFGLLLFAALISALFANLSGTVSGDGSERGFIGSLRLLFDEIPLTEETPMGTRVEAVKKVSVMSEPGRGILLGEQKRGAKGTVTDGPVERDGTFWWYVDFEDGVDGWAAGDELAVDNFENVRSFNDGTPIGSPIENTSSAELWSIPGGGAAGGSLIGVQQAGARGIIIEGPHDAAGERWWRVQYEDGSVGWVRERDLKRRGALVFFANTFAILLTLSRILTLVFLTGIVYALIRLNQIRSAENMKFREATLKLTQSAVRNERFERVQELLESESPQNWRLAILDADVILDELVTRMGHHGESLGEKLKGIEESDFESIEAAWEAHKVRNRIAHDGGDFILTQREARRVVALYEMVFREFGLV